ncbi:excinuclease ABC subunit C [Rhizomicrobium palustre]|uniref:UvrABC system protein C n=1 Tax=Rhizomicrobium palustre TaxID=189966 RepID=A0A846MXI3_9PROT|nr:excinuclease ABC subunit UvrC [Rhizomicrobium palustre]NIK87730.1 excinuclease ABC subunit C [Rhizomicrobium palustre]
MPDDVQDIDAGDRPLRGVARIEAYLKTLPDAPGVYRMLGADGTVLYVGKAKSLKKRVSNYAKSGGHTERIARMISETVEMIFVTTASETEALLLESNLIKRLKPRYNVSYRDDKSFPNILLREDHPFPQLLKHRGARSTKGVYFGPFASAGAVNRTLNTLQRAFLLRSCSDSVFESRTRPCLLHQIKRCSAPCVERIDAPDYRELVAEAERFLEGKSRLVQDKLVKEMETAAEALDFEQAARYRDRIRAMSHIQASQGINPSSFAEADLFAIYSEGGEVCIQVFFFRAGQNWGNKPYFPRQTAEFSLGEVLESFIGQFYDERPAPALLLVSEDIPNRELLSEALSMRSEKKVQIAVPERGEKHDLIEMARTNAREQLARRMSENSAQRELLEGVADLFGLENIRRIEVYDNSHVMGAHAVGGMIVAGPEGFEKGEYRKFNIKSTELTPGDDYAMMREVLTRRFARLVKEDDEDAKAKKPDLALIDGGPGQLAIACQVFADLGVEGVTLVSISKGAERDAGYEHFHMPGREPFRLDQKSPVLYYLQRLRDEAHRFAIGTHRKKRSKAIGANPLDEIAGVGANRKRALLQHFGSAKAVSAASLADIEGVSGVSSTLAKKIYDFFHPGG